MAIPLNSFTPTPVPSAFLPPLDDAYQALTMRAPGGVAIGDGSAGREVQFWTIDYVGGSIRVAPASGVVAFTMPVSDVLSVSLAFDSNMGVVIAYLKADGAYLYYFNSLSSSYQTLFIAGVDGCRVAVDKTLDVFNAASDVIFAYTLAGVLYWRQQRDRYVTERTVGPVTSGQRLRRMGPNIGNRLQFEMSN